MRKLIEILEDVNFVYPEELEKQKCVYCVQKGVTIFHKKIYSILGINGSGKSTVLTLLAGLRKFNSGCVVYYFPSSEGKAATIVNTKNWSSIVAPPFWKKIGFSFQKPELIRALSVKANLELVLGKEYEEMALTLFEQEEWDKIKYSKTWNISGGQIQRLGIIRAFGQNQSLVFMDEPTNNLDKRSREKLVHFIKKYGETKTIILVSHDKPFLDMLNIETTFEIYEEKTEGVNYTKRILRKVVP